MFTDIICIAAIIFSLTMAAIGIWLEPPPRWPIIAWMMVGTVIGITTITYVWMTAMVRVSHWQEWRKSRGYSSHLPIY